MAIKGSFKAFGVQIPNAYARLGIVQGDPRNGWIGNVQVFTDADAVAALKTAEVGLKAAQDAYHATLPVSMQAMEAAVAAPDDADLKAAYESAVVAEIAADKALSPAQGAVNLAREAVNVLPPMDTIQAPYVSGQDPIVDLYAVLKENPNYAGMVDC